MPELEWLQTSIRNYPNMGDLSAATNLSQPTIRAVRDGTGNPTLGTLNTLAEFFTQQEA